MDIDVAALQTLMTQAATAADLVQGALAAPGDVEITCEICRCEWA